MPNGIAHEDASMRAFKLRFPHRRIPHWAERYAYQDGDADITALGQKARARGYLTRTEFLKLCHWKTPRTQPWCARNPTDRIREATRLALGTSDERARSASCSCSAA